MKKISKESIEQRKKHLYEKFNKEDAEILIKLWLEISPEEFEYFVAYSLEKIWGMKMFVTWWFDDWWIDIKWKRTIMGRDEYFAIQCKRWNSWQVWEWELKKFVWSSIKAKFEHNARLFFVCTNELTYSAKKYSDIVWIEYVDEDIILQMYKMIDWNNFQSFYKSKKQELYNIHQEKIRKILQIKSSTIKDLFLLLKEIRFQIAREFNLPAYCVFDDNILVSIFENKPKTKQEFLKIKWVWENKYEKYWEYFMNAIKNYPI